MTTVWPSLEVIYRDRETNGAAPRRHVHAHYPFGEKALHPNASGSTR